MDASAATTKRKVRATSTATTTTTTTTTVPAFSHQQQRQPSDTWRRHESDELSSRKQIPSCTKTQLASVLNFKLIVLLLQCLISWSFCGAVRSCRSHLDCPGDQVCGVKYPTGSHFPEREVSGARSRGIKCCVLLFLSHAQS